MDYTVDAVDKAIGLLNLVAQFPDLGVTELAKRSGNTKARAFRLLGTLELNGLVQRDANAAYRLGNHMLYLGAAAKEQLSIVRVSSAIFDDMVRECNEGIQIRIREGTDSVCIARRDSTHDVRSLTAIGNRRPLYLGASGKLGKQLRWAGEQGARWCLIYGHREQEAGLVQVRNMLTREESDVPAAEIGSYLTLAGE